MVDNRHCHYCLLKLLKANDSHGSLFQNKSSKFLKTFKIDASDYKFTSFLYFPPFLTNKNLIEFPPFTL